MKFFLYFFCSCLVPTAAHAAESLAMGSALLQMLWALLIVIGVILIIFGLARKRFGFGRMQQGKIKILELRQIMPKNTLALVEVNGKVMLLGIGANQINLLTDYPEAKPEQADFKTLLEKQQ